MPFDPERIVAWFIDEPMTKAGAPDRAVKPVKRGRGRPRKERPGDWLNDPDTLPMPIDVPPNILDEPLPEIERIKREFKADKASDTFLAAHRAGSNPANRNRHDAKMRALDAVKRDSATVIKNPKMSAAAMARHIVRRGKSHGLKERAIADEISRMKKVCKAK